MHRLTIFRYSRYLIALLLVPAWVVLPLSSAEKKLILHADDYGMSHAVNVATQELLEKKAISSASLMMPCPWVAEAAQWLKSHKELDIGLHLTLTSEWKTLRWGPVAAREQVQGLLDPDGYLWRDVQSVARNATPQEVETELRAQIQLAQRMGIRFTHLDTHMGTVYARPDFFQVYEKLGKEFGVPIMLPKPFDGMERAAPAEVVAYLNGQQQHFADTGVFLLDSLIMDGSGGKHSLADRRKAYHETLRGLKPGVTQLIIHPGVLSDELAAATGRAGDRDGDYRIFLEAETRELLKELDIELVGWQDVAPSRQR